MADTHNNLVVAVWALHRVAAATPVVADAAIGGGFPATAQLLNTAGYQAVRFAAALAGGTQPKVTVEIWSYDPDGATFYLLDTVADVEHQRTFEVRTCQTRVFARLAHVTGAPTSVTLRVTPGEPGA